jgi:hypothetical protein
MSDKSAIIAVVVSCPHCTQFVIIEQLNCMIFRHGILKANGKQIDPHSKKELCDYYVMNDLIHGCGKPFVVKQNGTDYIAEICDYI